MREGQYEYIHEFKEMIDEIISLQKKDPEIIESNKHNPQIQQTTLAALHKFSITLNLYDVALSIVNGITLSATLETKTVPTEAESIITV